MYLHYATARPARRPHHHHADAAAVPSRAWSPRVDIREDADRYLVLADLPGVDPQRIAVEMDGNVLTISGERDGADVDASQPSRIERRSGPFRRSFALPDNVDAQGIVATGQFGVLELSIPKKPELAPRRIQVGVRALDADAGGASVQ